MSREKIPGGRKFHRGRTDSGTWVMLSIKWWFIIAQEMRPIKANESGVLEWKWYNPSLLCGTISVGKTDSGVYDCAPELVSVCELPVNQPRTLCFDAS